MRLIDGFCWAALMLSRYAPEANLAYLQVDPGFDALRPDPRFQDLRRRMKF
jgi:hypothetical protein